MYTYAVSAVRCFNRWGARELQSRSYAQCLCNFGAVWCVEQLCRLRQVVVKSRFAGFLENGFTQVYPPERLVSRRHFNQSIKVGQLLSAPKST